MSETTHTPLPWKVGGGRMAAYHERHTIRGANGEYICRAQHGEYGNASLIVTAVNHHAELVSLLRDVADYGVARYDQRIRDLLARIKEGA